MPNKPKTPHRTIRIDDGLWEAFREVCEAGGRNQSEVIRDLMARYVAEHREQPRAE